MLCGVFIFWVFSAFPRPAPASLAMLLLFPPLDLRVSLSSAVLGIELLPLRWAALAQARLRDSWIGSILLLHLFEQLGLEEARALDI